jgi:hypothetical protein
MPIFYGKSKDLKFMPDNNKAWLDYLVSVDGKALVVDVDKEYGIRSQRQNRYYWKCLEIIGNETGHTSIDLHELFKRLFLVPRYTTILGRELKLPSSTQNLNKTEFGTYFEKIRSEVATMGITLPDPIDPKDEGKPVAYPENTEKITAF